MSSPLKFSAEFQYYVHATEECIPLLERCAQNQCGPYLTSGTLAKILAGAYRCFRVDSDGMHPWEYTIHYQGRDLDRIMLEFITVDGSRLFASADGKNWESIGHWCRATVTWGSSLEHANGANIEG